MVFSRLSSQTLAPSTPSSGVAIPAKFPKTTGKSKYYSEQSTANTTSVSVGTTYWFPLYIGQTTTFNEIGVRVTTNNGGAINILKLGVYNQSNGEPTTPAYEAPEVSIPAGGTGLRMGTGNFTLEPGWYFTVFVHKSGSSMSYTATAAATTSYAYELPRATDGISHTSALFKSSGFNYTIPFYDVTGTTFSQSISNVPAMILKVA